ncbi:Zinc finger CCCH domain-containing protein 14, partial [Geodia barretti]
AFFFFSNLFTFSSFSTSSSLLPLPFFSTTLLYLLLTSLLSSFSSLPPLSLLSFPPLSLPLVPLDNELPDYIMVMLVNKKTFHQISNDLQLFLGDDTSNFIDWLQEAVDNGGTVPVKTKTSSEPNEKEGEHARTKSDSKTDDAGREETAHISEDSPGESGSKRSGSKQRSKSEDELELHPALDWEEEREGGRRG